MRDIQVFAAGGDMVSISNQQQEYISGGRYKNMKNKILVVTAILSVMVTMTGIVAAEDVFDCRENTNVPQYDFLSPHTSDNGNVRTYLLDTFTKSGASVIEYCVYPTPGFTGSTTDLTALYTGGVGPWTVDRPGSKIYFGFDRTPGGDPNNLPINGGTDIPIGKADYKGSLPTSELILFHINDPKECQPTDQSDTCWRKPGTPPPPVPEMSTMILTFTGMVGLLLFSREYRKS